MRRNKNVILLLSVMIPLFMFCAQESEEQQSARHMTHEGDTSQHGHMMNMDTMVTHMHDLQNQTQAMMVWKDYQQSEMMTGHGETMQRMIQNMNDMGQNMQQFMDNMNRMMQNKEIMKNEHYQQNLGNMQEHMNEMMNDYEEMLSTMKEFKADKKNEKRQQEKP
ncbi:hypothetical protein GF407_14400 [candidate division KSB1 bacterium]|nr:hypothetical protein [candidate division KSB1 bacterium]